MKRTYIQPKSKCIAVQNTEMLASSDPNSSSVTTPIGGKPGGFDVKIFSW